MGYEDEMNDYYDEVNKKSYYTLTVPAGTYSSNNIFQLMWEVFKHRLWHLIKHRRWMD